MRSEQPRLRETMAAGDLPSPSRQCPAEESSALPFRHSRALEMLLGVLQTSVELEMRCDLARAPTGEPQNAEAFRTHFTGLDVLLEQWNAAIDRAQTAPQALWRRFGGSARDRGITEPPFIVGALIDHLATWTVERSRRWELDIPQKPAIEHFEDRVGDDTFVSVYMMGRRVASLPGGARADVQRRVVAVDKLIQALFDEARTCPEARQIGATHEALLDVKQRLLETLARDPASTRIVRAPGCPGCLASAPA